MNRTHALSVVDLDLGSPDGPVLSFRPAPGGPPAVAGDVYALVRLRGRPAATVLGHVPEGADAAEVLAALARPRLAHHNDEPEALEAVPPRATVVVATRERADQLARALDSLLDQDHPDHELLVVDNAPTTRETEELVTRKYADRVRYVREDTPDSRSPTTPAWPTPAGRSSPSPTTTSSPIRAG